MKATPEDLAQGWAVAYAIAFAVTALGSEIRGGKDSPQAIDERARALADVAMDTVRGKLLEADAPRGRR